MRAKYKFKNPDGVNFWPLLVLSSTNTEYLRGVMNIILLVTPTRAKKNILIIIVTTLTLFGCRRLSNCDEKEKYTLTQTQYIGNDLKMNGYYYNLNEYPLIFYNNGVAIFDQRSSYTTVFELEGDLVSGEYYNKIKNDIFRWTIFNIGSNEIKCEGMSTKTGIGCLYPRMTRGTILNDTTIVFNNKTNSDGTESVAINDTFRFKQFSPKPDSTNSFIP